MWTNRIVGYSEEPPDQLLANPKNYRTHPGTQAAALRGVLAEVGVVQNVLANKTTGFLIDGHLRVMEALKAGQPTIPVTWVELSEAEEATILATLDPLAALAGTDAAQLEALLRDVSTGDPAVAQMLDDLATEAGIVPGVVEGGGGDDFDATPEDGPTRTQAGELWQIGRHRLIVGDSTDPATIERLMGNERARGVFTSPPYDQQRTYEGNMAPDWRKLVSGVCLTMLPFLDPEAQIFINLGLVHRGGRVIRYWDGLIEDLEAADWPLFGWYVWDKQSSLPVNWHGRLAITHEWILHFAKEEVQPTPTVPTKHAGKRRESTRRTPEGAMENIASNGFTVRDKKVQDSVLRIQPYRESTEHPAAFPIALPQTFIDAYDAALWYEPFMGSGTTLVAGERTGRKVYGCEINPRYADVILRRAEAEGLTCERLDTMGVDDGE